LERRLPAWLNTTNVGAAALALLTLAGLGWWVFDRISHVHVSDARIAATMINVPARVEGWVESFPVEEGQRVQAHRRLLTLDGRRARLRLRELEAELATLGAERERMQAQREMLDLQLASRLAAARARLEAARYTEAAAASELERASADWERATPLLERDVISRQRWERDRADYHEALNRHRAAEAEVARAHAAAEEAEAGRSELEVLDRELARLGHRIEQARAHKERQAVTLEDHIVRAPIDGIIDETFVDVGEFVNRGQRLLMLHAPERVWVSANVKETDIRHLEVGAPAEIHVDAYPGRPLIGRITRIGNAATSEFALLPNPNPSGNFTKITQRLEVRIDLESSDHDLRPGMMVEVEIDI